MQSSRRLSARPFGAILFGAVLVAALLSTERAEASCGYYVKVRNPIGQPTSAIDQHAPLLPCNGPSCRDDGPRPTPETPFSLSWEDSENAIGLNLEDASTESDSRLLTGTDPRLPGRSALRIDRPPQSPV